MRRIAVEEELKVRKIQTYQETILQGRAVNKSEDRTESSYWDGGESLQDPTQNLEI